MSNVKATLKMKSFVKQFVAIVEGDKATATAQKALRQADSGLTTHIAVLKGDLVGKEDNVTSAQEALDSAKVNGGKEITDRDQYVKNLLSAKNRLTEAEEALEAHKAKLTFLEETKAELETEV